MDFHGAEQCVYSIEVATVSKSHAFAIVMVTLRWLCLTDNMHCPSSLCAWHPRGKQSTILSLSLSVTQYPYTQEQYL